MKANKRFNIRENIIENIPKIIECFVEFYGEENRQKIVDKFNKLVIVGYLDFKGYGSILDFEKSKLANSLVEEFKKETNITSNVTINTIFGYFIKNFDNVPLLNELKLDLNYDFNRKSLLNFLKDYSKEDLTSLDEPRAKEVLEELKRLVPYINRIKEKYDERYNETLKQYDEYFESMDKLDKKLLKHYTAEFYKDISDLIRGPDKEIIESEELENKLEKLKTLKLVMGGPLDLLGPGLLDSFSKESEEMLNDPDILEWKKDSIKDDRVRYFNALGINKGKNSSYEDYMNDEICKKAVPTKDKIERIIKTRNKYKRIAIMELLESMPHHKSIYDEINSMDLLINPEVSRYINNRTTCIFTDYVLENGEYVERPILFFDGSLAERNIDCALLHELNHLYELKTISVNKSSINAITGWDIVHEDIKEDNSDEHFFDPENHNRKYEAFNEVINEFIAQDICKIMHEKGLTLTNDIKNVSNATGTIHDIVLRNFTKDFYIEFKNEIIESRKEGNISILLEIVGKEDFDEFNDLLSEIYTTFNEGTMFSIYGSINNNVVTDKTMLYMSYKKRTEEYMERFRENKAKYLNSHGSAMKV